MAKAVLVETESSRLVSLTLASRNGVIDSTLLRALSRSLAARSDDRVVILTGSGKRFFCPGLDLEEVARLTRPRMKSFMESFQELCLQLYSHPAPTIAALNGHALAGGCILASCCDFRVARSGARIGLTDLNLDLPVPHACQRIIEQLLGYTASRNLFYQGLGYSAEEALGIGWLDRVVEPPQLGAAVEELAAGLARQSGRAFRIAKAGLKEELAARLRKRLSDDLEAFLEQWFSAEVQDRLTTLRRKLRGGLEFPKTEAER